MEYRRSNLLPSDHKPVSALFTTTLRQVVESKEKIVFRQLMNELSKYMSKAIPIVEISGLKIHFDKLGYEVKKDAMIEIKNLGESIVYWRFVPKLEETFVVMNLLFILPWTSSLSRSRLIAACHHSISL